MKNKRNSNYILQNLDNEIPVCYWTMYIDNFFGREKAEKFYEYLINAHGIMRKNDIRKIINHISLSVYSFSAKEQIAFIGIYRSIDINSPVVKNMKNGFEKIQELYRNKNMQLSKKIKKLGYSYTTIKGYWKDKKEKDTYQQNNIFVVFSENEEQTKFKNDMCKLAQYYNLNSVLITDIIKDNNPKTLIQSNLFGTNTGNELENFQDTTTEVVEKYFSDLCDTKFLFDIPYKNNKKILILEDDAIKEYYTPKKQELVKKSFVNSFNMGMYKQALLNDFLNENYNI